MTAQIPDNLVYNDDEYELMSDYPRQLPMLDKLNMKPTMISTGCHRGYVAGYLVENSQLHLTYLHIYIVNGEYPKISGVSPSLNEHGVATYDSIHESVPYTGKLVIGRELAPFGWPDFRTAHNYKAVLRMSFDKGNLLAVEDISSQVAPISSLMLEILNEMQLIQDYKHRKIEMDKLYRKSFNLTHGISDEES